MKNKAALLAMLIFGTGCHRAFISVKRPFAHLPPDQMPTGALATDEYWTSPFITNGNGQTHICAHIYEGNSGKWVVELPGQSVAPTDVVIGTSYAAVAHYARKQCNSL